jgi:hypothetical protein
VRAESDASFRCRWMRLLFVVSLLSATASIQAGTGWSSFGAVSQLNQNPGVGVGGDLVFFNVTGSTNPSGCSVADGFYLNIVNERHKRLFAMLMMAQASGRNVQVYVTGTCHAPWGFAEIQGLTVE